MAWAERQRSGRWAGKYRDAAGRTRGIGRTFSRKAEAERVAAVEEDKARRRPGHVDPRDGRITWGTWAAQQWWPRRAVEPGTAGRDEPRFRLHLLPRWGRVPLTAIRRPDVQEWVDDLQKNLGPQSVVHCYHLFSKSLRDAVVAEKIEVSPCHDINLPVLPDGDDRYLTYDEVDRIATVLDGRYRTMVLTLCGAGLRWGEAAGLHWHRIDLDRGVIRVAEVHDTVERAIKPYPKGRKLREVYLPDWLGAELTEHVRRMPPGPSCALGHRGGARCHSSLVFPSNEGTPIGHSNFRTRHWNRAVGRWMWRLPSGAEYDTPSAARRRKGGEDAEPVWRDGLARIGPATPHDCRHTYASWNLQGGPDAPPMPIHELALAMGHTDTAITRRYGHLAGAHRDRARVAGAWRGSRGSATHLPRFDEQAGSGVIDLSERFRSSDSP